MFCGTGFEAITKRALTEVSRSIVVIADSSKFARNALVRVCEWAAIDRVVVDDGITDDAQAMLDDHGITVDVVATSGPILRT